MGDSRSSTLPFILLLLAIAIVMPLVVQASTVFSSDLEGATVGDGNSSNSLSRRFRDSVFDSKPACSMQDSFALQ